METFVGIVIFGIIVFALVNTLYTKMYIKVLFLLRHVAGILEDVQKRENRADNVDRPSKDDKEMNFLNPEETKLLLKTTEGIFPYHTLIWLAVNTGMRRGELMGLKWEDINSEERTIKIRRQMIRKQSYDFELTSPKSKSAKRTIVINESTVEKLKQHRKVQLKLRMKSQDWEENNFTFTNESGEFVKPASLRSFLNSKLKEAGLKKIRFHDFRHTCASLLLSRGADPQAVSNMLGHSRVSTTMDVYGHLMPANKKEIGNTMEALLS